MDQPNGHVPETVSSTYSYQPSLSQRPVSSGNEFWPCVVTIEIPTVYGVVFTISPNRPPLPYSKPR